MCTPRTACRVLCHSALNSFLALLAIAQTAAPVQDLPKLIQKVTPSVVTIIIRDETGRELGTGSGFVVAGDGKVVTNLHVVTMSGAAGAEVRFCDGASYRAEGVLATDADRDLALLQIRATGKNFPFLSLGNSELVLVGERVVAIGSPLAGVSRVNTENTVSDGIVSGVREWPSGKMHVFQITTLSRQAAVVGS